MVALKTSKVVALSIAAVPVLSVLVLTPMVTTPALAAEDERPLKGKTFTITSVRGLALTRSPGDKVVGF